MAERHALSKPLCPPSSLNSVQESVLAGGPSSSRAYQAASGQARRRSRTKARADEVAQPTSSFRADTEDGEPHQPRTRRLSAQKPSETSTSSPRRPLAPRTSPATELAPSEKDLSSFFPRLGRILEGKENDQERRRRKSATSSKEWKAHNPRQLRTGDEAGVAARRAARHKQSALQRHADALASLANPSLLSVLSGLTNASNTSSGSNSTITQNSYERSSVSKRKRRKERQRRSSESERHPSKPKRTMDCLSDTHGVFQYMQPPDSSMDVDLAKKYSRPHSSSSESSDDVSNYEMTSRILDPQQVPWALRKDSVHDDADIHQDKFNSDSGISVRGSSPERLDRQVGSNRSPAVHFSMDNPVKQPEDDDDDDDEDSDEDEDEDEDEEHDPPQQSQTYALEKHRPESHNDAIAGQPPEYDRWYRRLKEQEEELRQHVLQSPQPQREFQFFGSLSPNPPPAIPIYEHNPPYPYYPGYLQPPIQAPQPPVAPQMLVHPAPPYTQAQYPFPNSLSHPGGNDFKKTTFVGYELLANTISDGVEHDAATETGIVRPMYRKFEHLNHRILLHLQDEISEMEEELRYLDECIAQMSKIGDEGYIQPASRRAEIKYGTDMHHRRTELLGRIFLKLNQYNQALSAYSTMTRTVEPAAADDIRAYREWMEKHAPVEKAERQFLQHGRDLMSIGRCKVPVPARSARSVQSVVHGLPLIVLLPILAYAFIPDLLGRLFVTLMIVGAEAAIVTLTDISSLMSEREWMICAAVYSATMVILACVVR